MKLRIWILTMVVMLALPACRGQQDTWQLNVKRPVAPHEGDGMFYFLPRTAITVDVKVIQSTHQPGPFASYADKYLGLQGVIRDKSIDYTLAEITINGFAEPDPDQVFFVEVPPGKAMQDIMLSLNEAGLIQSVNKRFDKQEYQRRTLASKAHGSPKDEAVFNYFIESNLQERIDTIIEHVFVDTVTVERKTLRRSWVEKSSEVRAKEVADYIINLRDKKFDLITGFAEIPYSRETIQYMYEEMNKKEQAYLELFTGITSAHIMAYRFTFVPNPRQPQLPQTLFYFSPENGISSESRQGSSAVSFEIVRNRTTETLSPFLRAAPMTITTGKGFFYRIPEMCTVIIRRGGATLAETTLPISQYGVVSHLPPTVTEIEFYPETGAIRTISIKAPGDIEQDN